MTEPTKAEIDELAFDAFSAHHFDVQYTANVSWRTCSRDIRDWYFRIAESLISKGYRKSPPAKPACEHDFGNPHTVEFCKKCGCATGLYCNVCHACPCMCKPACEHEWGEPNDIGLRYCIKCHPKGKPSAGWPTVEDIINILYDARLDYDRLNKKSKNILSFNLVDHTALAIHAAFTKCLKERGIL